MKRHDFIQTVVRSEMSNKEQIREACINQSFDRATSGESQNRKEKIFMKRTIKRLAPMAACLVLVIAAVAVIPNLFNNSNHPLTNPTQSGEQSTNNPPASGIVIVGEKRDGFGDAVDENAIENPVYISPMLQNAINSAKPEDKIKTVVLVPGFYDYLNAFELDGVVYGELSNYLRSGAWKNEFGWEFANSDSEKFVEETEAKLAHMQEQAYLAFYAKTVSELEIENAEPFTSEYPGSYTFIAVLSPDKILSLKEEKCFMWLWSAGQDGQFEIQPEDLIAVDE